MSNPENEPKPTTEELRSFLTFRMARVQAKLNAQAMHLLRTHSELTLVEWRVIQLLTLLETASMSQIAREVLMDKGQLSRKIKTLVERGIVISIPNETDARQQKLRLSPSGVALNKELMPMMRRRQKLLAGEISEDDFSIFLDVLAKIEAAAEIRNV